MTSVRDTEAAFKWIVGLLNKHDIPFQISGGFAARIYGSQRELADIDIVMQNRWFEPLSADAQEYITFGPGRHIDENWDLLLMTMNYRGQEIDIAGTEDFRVFDNETKTWREGKEDISNSEYHEVYGLTVPVIPKHELIAYKKRLGREVDIADVAALEK